MRLSSFEAAAATDAFEAAAAAGCQRICFASSINAIRGYTDKPPEWLGENVQAGARAALGIDDRAEPGVAWDDPVMPPNLYGATVKTTPPACLSSAAIGSLTSEATFGISGAW